MFRLALYLPWPSAVPADKTSSLGAAPAPCRAPRTLTRRGRTWPPPVHILSLLRTASNSTDCECRDEAFRCPEKSALLNTWQLERFDVGAEVKIPGARFGCLSCQNQAADGVDWNKHYSLV